MKLSLNAILAFTAILSLSTFAFAEDDAKPSKALLIKVHVFQGDPAGSREAGTLKLLAEPALVTIEGRSFSFRVGGEIPVADGNALEFVATGLSVDGKAGKVTDGKVRLDLTLASTTGEQLKERTQFQTESLRSIATVRLGEVVKLRWNSPNGDKQKTWMELTVEEAKQ